MAPSPTFPTFASAGAGPLRHARCWVAGNPLSPELQRPEGITVPSPDAWPVNTVPGRTSSSGELRQEVFISLRRACCVLWRGLWGLQHPGASGVRWGAGRSFAAESQSKCWSRLSGGEDVCTRARYHLGSHSQGARPLQSLPPGGAPGALSWLHSSLVRASLRDDGASPGW